MRKILILLALAIMLVGSAMAAEPRINTAQVNWTQTMPSGEGIIFSGTVPATTTNTLYSDSGTLKFNGAAIGAAISSGVEATVGPTGDYVTDGTADDVQWQAAIDAAYVAGGGIVRGDAGAYNLAAQVVVRENVHLKGINNPTSGGYVRDWSEPRGTQFNITDTTTEAFVCYNGATIEDMIFYYPDQQTNATPDVYPATIRVATNGTSVASDILISRCLAVNPYYFVDGTAAHHVLRVTDCVGYPLMYGVKTNDATDIDYIQGNHWNPNYFYDRGTVLLTWVRANGYAFYIEDSDWPRIQNNFAWGYKNGLWMIDVDNAFVTANGFDRTSYGIGLTTSRGNVINDNQLNIWGESYTSPSETYGISIISGEDNVVEGNTIVSAARGILSNSAGNVFNGNKFRDCNTGENADGKGLYLLADADRNVVVGNQFNGNSRDNTIALAVENGNVGSSINSNVIYNYDDYGIFFVSGATEFTCIGNVAKGCGDGIADGSGSVTKAIDHNIETA